MNTNGPTVLTGTIHGKVIELDREAGLPDGQAVAVTVEPLPDRRLQPGDGIRRSAGAWADDADELDRFLEWNRGERTRGRREIPE
ncbi:MAG TPA: hypothetical protein VGF55_04065 [Gemmataceae bacterium]|jgi:hypothetical protein